MIGTLFELGLPALLVALLTVLFGALLPLFVLIIFTLLALRTAWIAALALTKFDGLPLAFNAVGLGVIRDGGSRCCCCCCGGGCCCWIGCCCGGCCCCCCTGNARWTLGVNAIDWDGNCCDCIKILRCKHFFCCWDKWKVGNKFGWSCNSDCNCGWMLPVETSSSGLSVKIVLPTIPLVGLDAFDELSILVNFSWIFVVVVDFQQNFLFLTWMELFRIFLSSLVLLFLFLDITKFCLFLFLDSLIKSFWIWIDWHGKLCYFIHSLNYTGWRIDKNENLSNPEQLMFTWIQVFIFSFN